MRPGQAVEKIDFNARINFNAGDKPSFHDQRRGSVY